MIGRLLGVFILTALSASLWNPVVLAQAGAESVILRHRALISDLEDEWRELRLEVAQWAPWGLGRDLAFLNWSESQEMARHREDFQSLLNFHRVPDLTERGRRERFMETGFRVFVYQELQNTYERYGDAFDLERRQLGLLLRGWRQAGYKDKKEMVVELGLLRLAASQSGAQRGDTVDATELQDGLRLFLNAVKNEYLESLITLIEKNPDRLLELYKTMPDLFLRLKDLSQAHRATRAEPPRILAPYGSVPLNSETATQLDRLYRALSLLILETELVDYVEAYPATLWGNDPEDFLRQRAVTLDLLNWLGLSGQTELMVEVIDRMRGTRLEDLRQRNDHALLNLLALSEPSYPELHQILAKRLSERQPCLSATAAVGAGLRSGLWQSQGRGVPRGR